MFHSTQDIVNEVARAKDEEIRLQLSSLCDRNLLVWEEHGPPEMVMYPSLDGLGRTFKYVTRGRLVLKNEEYVLKLENENKILREKLSAITEAVKGLL